MAYWRMQLHPSDSQNAVEQTVSCLGKGYIGLDFEQDIGDLLTTEKEIIKSTQQDYWYFAHSMKVGDHALIIAHHYPFALVEVVGEYNYIRDSETDLGIWCRHFRKVKLIGFYADYTTNAKSWQQLIMTDTISILNDPNSKSYKLIEEWYMHQK
ncbi:hypothetical protein KQI52_15510 [bacterium]|nr:hypothetical protein [bacterium]